MADDVQILRWILQGSAGCSFDTKEMQCKEALDK